MPRKELDTEANALALGPPNAMVVKTLLDFSNLIRTIVVWIANGPNEALTANLGSSALLLEVPACPRNLPCFGMDLGAARLYYLACVFEQWRVDCWYRMRHRSLAMGG